jgi:hypothetical protein
MSPLATLPSSPLMATSRGAAPATTDASRVGKGLKIGRHSCLLGDAQKMCGGRWCRKLAAWAGFAEKPDQP